MKGALQFFAIGLFIIYGVVCALLYSCQEFILFLPQKLNKGYRFSFSQPYEEQYIKMADGTLLNALLFKASAKSKGVIFYLHGNAGSLASWGYAADLYTTMGYDVFMLDYRGYGKSEGKISSQQQLFDDVQTAYDKLKQQYRENEIVVLGYSLGTGLATKVASMNNPKLLILQAPYLSILDMAKRTFPFIPSFIVKYKLETNKYIQDCNMPIVLFHGTNDGVIYYESSVKLKDLIQEKGMLIPLEGQGHNGMTDNPDYIREVKDILESF